MEPLHERTYNPLPQFATLLQFESQECSGYLRWMQIRRIAIKTVDGLSPMPVSSAWVRDGIFVVGMDSEFAVYSQWRDESDTQANQEIDTIDGRHLQEEDLLNIVQVS